MLLRTRYSAKDGILEAGLDEAGRGAAAGPIVAAAVILKEGFASPAIQDSKRLNAAQRQKACLLIQENSLSYAVVMQDNIAVDNYNPVQATMRAMHQCIAQLSIQPQLLLIDGNYFVPCNFIPHQCVVKGDGIFISIAAASILAKVFRDQYMQYLHHYYPHYEWQQNKGYPTPAHKKAILRYGHSPQHRKTFQLFKKTPSFAFNQK